MALNTHVSLAQLDAGYIEIYSGLQPATPDVPVDRDVNLAIGGTVAMSSWTVSCAPGQ